MEREKRNKFVIFCEGDILAQFQASLQLQK